VTPDLPGHRLEHRLGGGGGAEVWLAWPGTGGAGPVAVKRAPAPDLVAPDQRADAVERLRAEGRVLAGIDHPNLVTVLDVVEDPGGLTLVLPFLAGGTLRDLLDDRGTLGAGELLAVVAPVADALRALLDHGHVHGDVKPENVLFTEGGAPVLIDAGTARPVDDRSTEDAVVVGTPDYLDPCRLDGRPAAPATDVFSLGVLAYEALTGRRPHRGEPAEVLASASVGAHRPLASWPTVDGGVAEVVERALAPDPSTRPADPAALAAELQRVVPATSVRLPGPARSGPLPARPGHLETLRVARPDGDPPPVPDRGPPRRVGAVRAAVAAISVALAIWAGPGPDAGSAASPDPGGGGQPTRR
jgi:eukaryotic-like serine/threonine-protein kinase